MHVFYYIVKLKLTIYMELKIFWLKSKNTYCNQLRVYNVHMYVHACVVRSFVCSGVFGLRVFVLYAHVSACLHTHTYMFTYIIHNLIYM